EGVLLRQARAVALPAVGAVSCLPDRERAARRESAFLGGTEGDHPAGVRITRMGAEDEPELGAQALADVLPGPGAVGRSVDPAVVLLVEAVRLARRHHELVDALARFGVGVRRVAVDDAAIPRLPRGPAVFGRKRPDRTDRDPHLLGVGGAGDDRVADQAARSGLPARPARMLAQALHMPPGC